MTNLIGHKAPDFTANAVMANNEIEAINLHKFIKGKYSVLFFYPLDFTFVCPSEILAFNSSIKEFEKRDTQVIAVSVDSEFSHLAYKNTSIENGGIGNIQYPLVADITKQISKDYDVLLNNSVALRGLFIIDAQGNVRHQLINDLPLGRSVAEALRIVDAIQHHTQHGEVCPANWRPGADAMHPSQNGVIQYLKKLVKSK